MLDIFSSHRTHRFYRIFLRTVLNSQNASGIQISQSVKTIVDTNKGQHKADILLIGVSRWSLPFPPGEGSGEGPLFFWPLWVLFFCVFLWEKEQLRNSLGRFSSRREERALQLNLAMRFRKELRSYDDKKNITLRRERLLLNMSIMCLVITFITYTKSECYEWLLRICPSCSKKGVFNVQEGHVLERRRASSCHMLAPLFECWEVG